MKEPKKSEEKKVSTGTSILRFSGLGLQTALIIGGGAYLGSLLDEKYQTEKSWFTLVFVLVSVTLAIVYTIRILNRYNK